MSLSNVQTKEQDVVPEIPHSIEQIYKKAELAFFEFSENEMTTLQKLVKSAYIAGLGDCVKILKAEPHISYFKPLRIIERLMEK